jgi:hypothetical protein
MSITVSKEVVDYIAMFGGRCRDCADCGPVCPNSGLPCGGKDKAIRHVLQAYNYGVKYGFLKPAEHTANKGSEP